MFSLRFCSLGLVLIHVATGCTEQASSQDSISDGPIASQIVQVAEQNNVPAALMIAVGAVEKGFLAPAQRIVDPDELILAAGVLQLRHGRYNSLAKGAELMGTTEVALVENRDLGTEAAARVLNDLANVNNMDRSSWDAWASIIEEISGHATNEQQAQYRAEVFKTLRQGGDFKTREGEIIHLPKDASIPAHLTFAPPLKEATWSVQYPGAIKYSTPQCTGSPCTDSNMKYYTERFGYEISTIIIHDTECSWDAAVATLQNDPGKSVHYIVDDDGSRVGQFIPESYDGWHCGNSYYNAISVGIEHVGYAAYDDYSTEMYLTSADLVNVIADRYDITLDRDSIIAHAEVPDSGKIDQTSPPCDDGADECCGSPYYGGTNNHTDPGIYWEWCQYMYLIGGECRCTDSYEHWNCVHDLSMMTRCSGGDVEFIQCADECTVKSSGQDDECTELQGTGGSGGASSEGGSGGSGGTSSTESGSDSSWAFSSSDTSAGGSPIISGTTPTTSSSSETSTSSSEDDTPSNKEDSSTTPAAGLTGHCSYSPSHAGGWMSLLSLIACQLIRRRSFRTIQRIDRSN